MFSGLESVGAISIACLEYCSALASTCMASGALDFQLRGSVCPISASVDTSFGVNAISFSPTSCIFCMFPTCTYAKVNAPYTGDLYRLSGYFRINASPSSIFLAASFGVTAKKALYATSSSAFTGAGVSSVRGVASGVFGLSLCFAGGWLWLPWPYCEACAAAIPLPHTSSPATVAAPNQIFQFFLIRFLLFPSCFIRDSHLKIDLRSRPRYRLISAKRREPFLRRQFCLLRPAFHAQHGLILHFRYFGIPLIIENPCEVNVRPRQHHGILSRRMFTGGQAPEYLLGSCRIVIQKRHQPNSVPRPRLIRIFRQNFLKRCLRRARVFFRDPPLPLRQRRNDLCIIRHRRRRRASPARHFFTRCFVHQLGRLGRRKFHRRQPLRFTSYINGPHQIREKELHRRSGVFEFGQRHEERFHQNVPVFIVPTHRRLPFAGGHALQFQFHGAH